MTVRPRCTWSRTPPTTSPPTPTSDLPIARLLARRLQNVTSYLVDLKRQYRDREDHLGMVDEVLDSLAHEQGTGFIPASELPVEP